MLGLISLRTLCTLSAAFLILTRKLWLSCNTLFVTLSHGAFSRCYWVTFRVKFLWLKVVDSSAVAEHTSQTFLDVAFVEGVCNWINSRVH